jgi:hypothetical protein
VQNGSYKGDVWGARVANITYFVPGPPPTINPYASAVVSQPVAPSMFTSIPYVLVEDFPPATFFDQFTFGTVSLIIVVRQDTFLILS